jgi:Tfp pilus assembly protein PilW
MIKNYAVALLLAISVLAMAGFAFPIQDEILALLNARDTFTNVIGFVSLPLWWILVGVYEYTLIRLIYKQIKNK